MSRVQLALNVGDLDSAIDFYSRLFDTKPHKIRPGYANFEVANPPLKLVLMEQADRGEGTPHALNHLGVEVETAQEVSAATERLAAQGLATTEEKNTVCCHAEQDKVWVFDPSGAPWEVYTITDDNPTELPLASASGCCTPTPEGSCC